ncbi:uncharacterized protein [Primulina huaijiensis]|uniref:uncharacterized protein n=1 Tax=Primulina huaijiensis TaxID=1492673 RepID=UPI003CC70734
MGVEDFCVSLSSATNLARYLFASHTLPQLIHKVKFVKKILFSGSDDLGVTGKNALRMMATLSIPADEDVQQTLAFFEKIQARRGGLNLLGSNACFPYFIETFPCLLFLPLESRIQSIMKFLEDIGVPKGYIRNIFLLFPPILSYDIDKDIKPRLQSYAKIIMSSFNKIPTFSKEEFNDWKKRTRDHFAAEDDDILYVITDGPLEIMKAITAVALTDGAPRRIKKPRDERTSEEKRKANLENVAKDILYKIMDKNTFRKIKMCKSAKEILENLIQLCEEN